MTQEKVSVFKIKICNIRKHAIIFEISAGEKVKDTYVNILTKPNHGHTGRLLLTPKQFTDFAQRLIAYVYTEERLDDEELKILWDLKLNIFDNQTQQFSTSIFINNKKKLSKLGLLKGDKNVRQK